MAGSVVYYCEQKKCLVPKRSAWFALAQGSKQSVNLRVGKLSYLANRPLVNRIRGLIPLRR